MKPRMRFVQTLILIGVSLSTGLADTSHAADFFPMDVWEEMADWRSPKPTAGGLSDTVDHWTQQPSDAGTAGKRPATFPLDVWVELNALGNRAGSDAPRFSMPGGISYGNRIAPCWFPAELRTDPPLAPTADDFGDRLRGGLTDLR